MAAAVLWSLPILAAGLVALLRYGFGSLFVVGESVAALLLGSTGADVADALQRLQDDPFGGLATAGLGLALALGAAGLAWRNLPVALTLAAASAGWAWRCDMPWAAVALMPGCVVGLAGCRAARP